MQLVIEIPEEQFITLNAKSQKEVLAVIDLNLLINAIKNGKPLPEGHWELDEHLDKIGMIYKYKCSECGANHSAMYDYCPSCGSYNGGDTDADNN